MLNQYQHLLLPMDFSEKNQVALDSAYNIVSQNPARLTLLHVIEPIGIIDDDEIQDFTDQLVARADSELKTRAAQFSDLDVDVVCTTQVGNRSRTVTAFAVDNNVDLIIVSSHPIQEVHSARSMASVSYQIAVLANCAVLLLK